jgi:hypothetical protein
VTGIGRFQAGNGYASWTPSVSADTGSFTTVSASGLWLRSDARIDWHATITITTAGTATGSVRITLPCTPAGGFVHIGTGRESAATGAALVVINSGGGVASILTYNNASVIANGRTLQVAGSYGT